MASLLFDHFASTLGSTSADFCGDFREVFGYQSLHFAYRRGVRQLIGCEF
jgi:hypothetical protein